MPQQRWALILNDHKPLWLAFSKRVSRSSGNPEAQVTSGTATIGSGGVTNGGMVLVSGNTVTIPLTNARQCSDHHQC